MELFENYQYLTEYLMLYNKTICIKNSYLKL